MKERNTKQILADEAEQEKLRAVLEILAEDIKDLDTAVIKITKLRYDYPAQWNEFE